MPALDRSDTLLPAPDRSVSMLARERLIEIAMSAAGVGAMVAFLYFVGTNYAEEVADGHQQLSDTGGVIVVYGIVGFIVLMALIGFALMRTVTVPEAGEDASDGSNT